MRSLGLRVARPEGEATRRALLGRSLLRPELEIVVDGDHLILPIRSPDGPGLPAGEVVEREFPLARAAGPSDYRELVPGPAELRESLPRSFDVIGDIVLIRVPPDLDDRAAAIGQALLDFVPTARIVGRDLGVHGPERRRRIDRIAGSGGWRTRHRENGLELEIDVELAYFSPRLAREHERVADAVQPGESVYDLCCGVGPFALTIARDGRARRVTAVDSNPAAVDLLRETARRYSLGDRLVPILAPIESFLPSASPVDRVVLNLPHEGIKYAPSVVPAVASGGRFHYYEITSRAEIEQRADAIMTVLEPGRWRLVDRHVVHPYAPTADLVAFEFERSGA